MRRYWDGYTQFTQPTATEIKRKSAASMKSEQSKGKKMEPVLISGRKIATSWWGQAWCQNLEQYADYESRLDRGKRYVRTGAVIDLNIQKGKILARVQGTRKTPYKIEIYISPLPEEQCQRVIEKCGRKIENLEQLTEGTFPKELKELFQSEDGLFPKPREISFHCSCPDWALMCKHVAATLYGVGARLDENPTLFFLLRGVDMDRFIGIALENKVEAMLANARRPSDRIIEQGDINGLFGVL